VTKNQNPIAVAEAELQNLRTRQSELQSRRGEAEKQRDTARAARKAALAADTAGDIRIHTTAVRNAEDELETIDSVLTDVQAQIQDTERKLGKARDVQDRAKAAEKLDQVGQEVTAAAEQLQAALAPLAKAFEALVSAIPATLKIVELPEVAEDRGGGNFAWVDHRRNAKPLDVARVVLAEALANACPGVFASQSVAGGDWQPVLKRLNGLGSAWITERFTHPQLTVTMTGPEAAVALVNDRLKARSAAILSGELGSGLDDVAPPSAISPPPPPKPPEPVKIIARETFTLEEFGARINVLKFETPSLAADVAAVAMTSGLAYRLDSIQGLELQKQVESGTPPRPTNNVRMGLVRKPDGEVMSVLADRNAAAGVTRLAGMRAS
jgi:hypothetical protein